MTWSKVPGRAIEYGLYDAPKGEETYMYVLVTQDVALRHGGGTNVHMGVGSQYANAKYNRRMSMGDRIASKIKRAKEKRILEQKVTRCSPAFIKMYMCCSRYLHRLSAIEFLQLIVKAGFFPCMAYVSFLFNEEVFQLPGLTT